MTYPALRSPFIVPSSQSSYSPTTLNRVNTPRQRLTQKESKVTTGIPHRVPLHEVETVIKPIEPDGAVILTDFSRIPDVEKVNSDAAPFIAAFREEVRFSGLPLNQILPHQIE